MGHLSLVTMNIRQYFKEKLKTLHLYTGLNQANKLNDEQASILLDSLEKVFNMYGKFPVKKKQQIIDQQILLDENLTALTPKKVAQWLSRAWENLDAATRQSYLSEKTKDTHQPCDPERAQKYIDKMRKELSTEPIKTKKSSIRFYGNEREQIKIKQEIVDCPKCTKETRSECGNCMGYGRIKRTL